MTLIEILIVVTIMALIAGAVGVSVMSAMRDARGKQARTDAQTLSSIATRFVLDHGRCPTSAQDLVEAGLTNRHGRTEDPWGGDYRFECEDDDVVASVHPTASSFRVSAALDPDLARRPPRIGFGLSFVGAANDLHADHPRQPGTNLRSGVLRPGPDGVFETEDDVRP